MAPIWPFKKKSLETAKASTLEASKVVEYERPDKTDENIEKDDLMLTTSLRNAGQGVMPITGTLNDATRQFQVEHIERAIETCSGNMTDAAEDLGIHRSNLYRKMGQLGMNEAEDSERLE